MNKDNEKESKPELVDKLKKLVLAYEISSSAKDAQLESLKAQLNRYKELSTSYNNLVDALKDRCAANEALVDTLRGQVEELSINLIKAANWIKRRKAADYDGWIPDDDLC